jgi:hypothetical protein
MMWVKADNRNLHPVTFLGIFILIMIKETTMFKYSLILILLLVSIPTAFAAEVSPEDILETRCTVCHNLDVVLKARKNKAEWESTINRMISNGAQLNDDEKEALIKYLSEK